MKRKTKKIIGNVLIVVFLALLAVFIYTTYESKISNSIKVSQTQLTGLKVSFLDVGQADAILVQVDNENMLIDAGNNNDGANLVTYLKGQNIDKFKYVVGTHAHEDHIGGLDNVINNFDVEHFFMPNVLHTTKTFEDVIDALASNDVNYEVPKKGSTYDLGEAKLDILYIGTDQENLNNTSIVIKLTYKNVKFLFMGDAEKEVEKKLLNKDNKADILKVSHHGSNTASTENFIKKVNPSYAVITAGKDNTYKLPSKAVINLLKKYKAEILRTDKQGTIIFTSDGESINYSNVITSIDGDENK